MSQQPQSNGKKKTIVMILCIFSLHSDFWIYLYNLQTGDSYFAGANEFVTKTNLLAVLDQSVVLPQDNIGFSMSSSLKHKQKFEII